MRSLQELNDLEDIRTLRLDYTHHFDGGDLEALLDLYTDDGVCDFGPFGTWDGKAALRSGWAPYFGSDKNRSAPFAHGRHTVTNPKVELRGDRATASWFLTDVVFREADGTAKAQPVVLYGTYVDECARVDGVWKLTRTTLHFSWPVAGGVPSGLIRGE